MRTLLIVSFAVAVAASATAAPRAATVPNKSSPSAPATAVQKANTQQPVTRAQLIKNLDAQFKALDTNGDGVLSQSELAAAEAKSQQQRLAQIRAQMDAEFNRLDKDHGGTLTKAEFMAAAPQSPTTAPDVSADLGQFDKNKDGKVTFDEYQSVMLARFDAMDKQHKGSITDAGGSTVTRADFASKLTAMFKQIDVGGHGYFTKAELQAAEIKIRQQRIAAARARMEAEFNRLDTDHDGTLSKAEFMASAPQPPKTPPNGADLMARLDKNHDGKITLDEYRAPVLERFDGLDTNHDGVLEPAEIQRSAKPSHR
jgi:Ca2+-binding EF-hand superfamily protein